MFRKNEMGRIYLHRRQTLFKVRFHNERGASSLSSLFALHWLQFTKHTRRCLKILLSLSSDFRWLCVLQICDWERSWLKKQHKKCWRPYTPMLPLLSCTKVIVSSKVIIAKQKMNPQQPSRRDALPPCRNGGDTASDSMLLATPQALRWFLVPNCKVQAIFGAFLKFFLKRGAFRFV